CVVRVLFERGVKVGDDQNLSRERNAMRWLLGILVAFSLVFAAHSQDSPYRKELKRAGLSGTDMEVITSINEVKPGEASALHVHHGEESFYVVEGGTIELPDGKQVPFPT